MLDQDLVRAENKYKKSIKYLCITIPALVFVGLGAIWLYVVGEVYSLKIPIIIILLIGGVCLLLILGHKRKEEDLLNLTHVCALCSMGLSRWPFESRIDGAVTVRSAQSVYGYDEIKYFKEDPKRLRDALLTMSRKKECADILRRFLENNEFKDLTMYPKIEKKAKEVLWNTSSYNIYVSYTSPAGRSHANRTIPVTEGRLRQLEQDKSLLMTKGEYSKYVKEMEKEKLEEKQHSFFGRINEVIDLANESKDLILIKGDAEKIDAQVYALFDKTINSIRKVKSADSEEWETIDRIVSGISHDVEEIIENNKRIAEYYESREFAEVKSACDTLMSSQREFNEYIEEKVNSIASLFGTRIIRNETDNEDEYAYIHPYKKSITPFTAEVSSSVFASAENKPLEYIVKSFYPDKARYPEQIQKLQLLIEELETLKDAKEIIENYKKEVRQYLTEVPSYVTDNDEDGFYKRLGFAVINENTLNVEYKFSYTSDAGKAQRSFTVPMTEDTIVELINTLESRLTMAAFTREQRSMMTAKLRKSIMARDNYTCCLCGNSTHDEPNLLLEIDHIVPVAKGGFTEEGNLQTLCWKCNRQKGAKLL